MSKLDDILQQVVRDVDNALGCAVVDLSSGLLLSVAHSIPYFTQSYLEAVAAAAVDMVRGKNVLAVESLLSSQRGKKMENSIKEIQMTTDNTYHFMAVVPEKPNSMVILITSRKANLGMGWSAVRTSLPRIAPLCPG
jgi:predicted regulator of Ras-like GTPase activity (Roadblock/LC7/MglB family)